MFIRFTVANMITQITRDRIDRNGSIPFDFFLSC